MESDEKRDGTAPEASSGANERGAPEPMANGAEGDGSRSAAPASVRPHRWSRALVWVERAVTTALLVFIVVRLGPQAGALLGLESGDRETPALEVTTLDGSPLTLAELRGKVVIVNFWATWCGPCKLEMPALQAAHERYDSNEVAVIGLSVDSGPNGVRAFLEERGITYPVGMATWEHRRAFGGIRGIPTTFVVDRSGTVRHRVVGYFTPPAMNAAVRRLLDEDAGPD